MEAVRVSYCSVILALHEPRVAGERTPNQEQGPELGDNLSGQKSLPCPTQDMVLH